MITNVKKSVAFILILAMLISMFSFAGSINVYAADDDGIVDLSTLNENLTIKSDGTIIYATTSGGVYTTATSIEGITLKGKTTKDISVILDGITDAALNVTLSDAAIDQGNNNSESIIKLTNAAITTLTLKGENYLSSGVLSYAGIEVTSRTAIEITGTGLLDVSVPKSKGAGIGGTYRFNTSANNGTHNNGKITITGHAKVATLGNSGIGSGAEFSKGENNIKIAGHAKVTAMGITTTNAGAGIGGGYGGLGKNIVITDNAIVYAKGGKNAAGIGGGFSREGEYIKIAGEAKVTAVGGDDLGGAGIGGGSKYPGKNITITDKAEVVAFSPGGCAGIGGAIQGSGEKITISKNAKVIAKSGGSGAGIGGGSQGNASEITITDNANVSATAVNGGAGIGGGNSARDYPGTAEKIIISGNAIVSATAENDGAGIGGGSSASGSSITIAGFAVVSAVSKKTGAGIGGGGFSGGLSGSNGVNITITGNSIVFAKSEKTGTGIGGGGSFSDDAIQPGTRGGYGKNIIIAGLFVSAKGNPNRNADDIGNGSGAAISASDIKILSGSVYLANNRTGCTPTGITGEEVFRVTVPAVYTGSNDSLRGHKKITVPLGGGQAYKAKTISSGAVEHGSTFPAIDASAVIYLPAGAYKTGNGKSITVGSYINGYADVKSVPSSVADNIVLWNKMIHITYDKNGADEVSGQLNEDVIFGGTYNLPTVTRAGYTFEGWYTATSGGVEITDASTVETLRPATLYAIWKANNYKVKFDPNGGAFNNRSVTSTSVTFDSKYTTMASVHHFGYPYDFIGWYTATSGGVEITSGSSVKIPNDHTLYARWKGKPRYIKFDANGGTTPSPLTMSATYGSPYGPLATTTSPGYIYYWYTKQTAAENGDVITPGTIVNTTFSVTLFAIWTKGAFTVTFNSNGGGVPSIASKTVVYQDKYGTLAAINRGGYTFNGWFTERAGGDEITAGSIYTATGPQILYAQWKGNPFVPPDPDPGPDPPEWNPFTDVKEDDWFHDDVKYVYENGLMQGTSSDKFSPDLAVTRGMAATVLWRMAGEPAATTPAPFYDLTEDWYKEAVAWAFENKIVLGYSSERFGPGDSITREQLVTMLWRYTEFSGGDISVEDDKILDKYKDTSKISKYAVEPFKWACENKLVQGNPDGTLNPQGTALRSELAALLHRYLES